MTFIQKFVYFRFNNDLRSSVFLRNKLTNNECYYDHCLQSYEG